MPVTRARPPTRQNGHVGAELGRRPALEVGRSTRPSAARRRRRTEPPPRPAPAGMRLATVDRGRCTPTSVEGPVHEVLLRRAHVERLRRCRRRRPSTVVGRGRRRRDRRSRRPGRALTISASIRCRPSADPGDPQRPGELGGAVRRTASGRRPGARQTGARRGTIEPAARSEARKMVAAAGYLPAARRWKRVRFSIFLCFFLRMRLRRFLISEPMASGNLAVGAAFVRNGRGSAGRLIGAKLGGRDSNPEDVDQNHACCQLHHPRSVAQPYWSR